MGDKNYTQNGGYFIEQTGGSNNLQIVGNNISYNNSALIDKLLAIIDKQNDEIRRLYGEVNRLYGEIISIEIERLKQKAINLPTLENTNL
jgi:hypothetical protein